MEVLGKKDDKQTSTITEGVSITLRTHSIPFITPSNGILFYSIKALLESSHIHQSDPEDAEVRH